MVDDAFDSWLYSVLYSVVEILSLGAEEGMSLGQSKLKSPLLPGYNCFLYAHYPSRSVSHAG